MKNLAEREPNYIVAYHISGWFSIFDECFQRAIIQSVLEYIEKSSHVRHDVLFACGFTDAYGGCCDFVGKDAAGARLHRFGVHGICHPYGYMAISNQCPFCHKFMQSRLVLLKPFSDSALRGNCDVTSVNPLAYFCPEAEIPEQVYCSKCGVEFDTLDQFYSHILEHGFVGCFNDTRDGDG